MPHAHDHPTGHPDPGPRPPAGLHADLLGAVEVDRIPEQGPTFFLGLRIGDSALGLVSDARVPIGVSQMPQRILLSIDVADVDRLLERVEAAGGRVLSPPNDMSWGQRVANIHDPPTPST